MTEEKSQTGAGQRFISFVGIILCIVFGFMLICNITIIVKGTINPERPPAVFSVCPMVVQSGSMSGTAPDHIEVGDLIFVAPIEAEELKVGDVISYMEENSATVITHRIVEIVRGEDGALTFRTKGDANNAEDADFVTADRLVGIYRSRIPKVGDFAMFLQTPVGMVVFIGIPLLAFIIYDIVRRQKYAKQENQRTAELEAELERLKAVQQSEKEAQGR